MIIGTAGHIDHGKTTLVQALTGTHTDRLPEERQRGISIELGYAFLETPEGVRVAFIDVPGHERLVHTMVSGATGMDLALLLVAADDGVMPQTREHLQVLDFLGVRQAIVVITKADRASAERIQEVRHQVRELLAPTLLAQAPEVVVSARTGDGVEVLRAMLLQHALSLGEHPRSKAAFRLAIDRVFSLTGAGTIVTGTVHAGRVAVGDELMLIPSQRLVRVRSVHAQNRESQEAQAGDRCALALVGVAKEQIERGDWVTNPSVALKTNRLDAWLTWSAQESRPVRSGTPVHLHIGSREVMATVAVLDPVLIQPGMSGLVQLVLREPIGAWYGDRLILRDESASRTVAGGQVLDPHAPVRYRRTELRLQMLQALRQPTLQQRLHGYLEAAPHGLDLRQWCAGQGELIHVTVSDVLSASPLSSDLALGLRDPSEHDALLRVIDRRHDLALAPFWAEQAQAQVLQALRVYHERHPDELGPDSARLRRLALPRLPEPLWVALLARMKQQGVIAQKSTAVYLPEHSIRLSADEERLGQKAAVFLLEAGAEGAWVRDLARDLGEAELLTRVTLSRLAQRGELYQVVKDLFYAPVTMLRLAAICREVAASNDGVVLAARYRDATGLGRKRAIQILEYFDRVGLLRRVGDEHRLRPDCQLFLPSNSLAAE